MNASASSIINYCHKCYNIPLINLIKNNQQVLISSYCSRCCQTKQISLSQFLSHTIQTSDEQNEIINKIKNNSFCTLHQKYFTYYCGECNTHCCEDCNSQNHSTHWNVELSMSLGLGEQSISTFGESIQKGETYIQSYLGEIKDTLIHKLYKQIRQIELAYNKMKMLNMNIISLMKYLFSNCFINIPNYNTITNVKNNMKLNIPSFTSSKEEIVLNFINFLDHTEIIPINSIEEKPQLQKLKLLKTISSPVLNNQINTICSLSDGRFAISNDKVINFYENTKYFNIDFVYPQVPTSNHRIIHFIHVPNSNIVIIGKQNEINVIEISAKSYSSIRRININYLSVYLCPLPFKRFAYIENSTRVQIKEILIESYTKTINEPNNIYGMTHLKQAKLLLIKKNQSISFYKDNSFHLEKVFEIRNATLPNYESVIEFSYNKIMFSSVRQENKIMIVDTLSFQMQTIISLDFFYKKEKLISEINNTSTFCCFELINDKYILIGNNSGGIALFDINEMSITETAAQYIKRNKKGLFDGVFSKKEHFHSNSITSIKQISINRILTTSLDGSSKIWEW